MKKENFKWLELTNVTFSDTETTGLNLAYYYLLDEVVVSIPDGEKCEIVELAGMTFSKDGKYEGFYEDICKPDILVGAIAASTHGYTNNMLKDAPKIEDTNSLKRIKEDVDSGKFIVFHNAPFDVKMFNIHGVSMGDKVIDTLRVCKHLYKDGVIGLEDARYYKVLEGEAPEQHKLQYFRYLFEMDDQPYFKEAMKMAELTEVKPHTALSDVFILWLFTAKLMKDFDLTLEDMHALTQKPILEKEFKFGKHKGKIISDVVNGTEVTPWGKENKTYEYFAWASENMSLSVDMEYTFNYEMGRGIINGIVPFANIKGKNYKPFLYKAIRESFNEEEIEKALKLLGKDKRFVDTIIRTSREKTEEYLSVPFQTIEEDMQKQLSVRENRAFLLNYVNKFRT